MSSLRCTECSRIVRPIVCLDIDGTLGEYHDHFKRFAQQFLGETLPQKYPGGIAFNEWLGLEKNLYRKIKLAYRLGGMKRSMPINPHAKTLVGDIRSVGAEIWITTTRPYLRMDNIDPDTRFWMERHGLTYDNMLYDEHKYAQLGRHVDAGRVAAILDDDPEQFDEASQIFPGKVIQIRGVHNSHVTARRSPSAATLAVARDMIQEKIVEWKAEHEHAER